MTSTSSRSRAVQSSTSRGERDGPQLSSMASLQLPFSTSARIMTAFLQVYPPAGADGVGSPPHQTRAEQDIVGSCSFLQIECPPLGPFPDPVEKLLEPEQNLPSELVREQPREKDQEHSQVVEDRKENSESSSRSKTLTVSGRSRTLSCCRRSTRTLLGSRKIKTLGSRKIKNTVRLLL